MNYFTFWTRVHSQEMWRLVLIPRRKALFKPPQYLRCPFPVLLMSRWVQFFGDRHLSRPLISCQLFRGLGYVQMGAAWVFLDRLGILIAAVSSFDQTLPPESKQLPLKAELSKAAIKTNLECNQATRYQTHFLDLQSLPTSLVNMAAAP